MNSATTNLTTSPARPHGLSSRSVPTIEDLYQMTSEPDERILFHDVDWSFYEQLLQRRNLRILRAFMIEGLDVMASIAS